MTLWPDLTREHRLAKIHDARNSGCGTASEIARHVGTTRNAIIGMCRRNNIPLAGVKKSEPSKLSKRKPQKRPPVPKPKPPSDAPPPLNLSLMDLTDDTCRWPIGHPATFCGHATDKPSRYCEYHHDKATQSLLEDD